MRANELRHLQPRHLDIRRSGLNLEAEWTKSRKDAFQPLPAELAGRLAESAHNDAGRRLYASAEARRRKPSKIPPPDDPLLYVPSHPGRELGIDLKRADIPKWTPEGKVDFHSLRTAYCTLVIESGANLKEAMTLVRHTSPELTANAYARTRLGRLHTLAEDVGRTIDPTGNLVTNVSVAVAVADPQAANDKNDNNLRNKEEWWRRRAVGPPPPTDPQRVKPRGGGNRTLFTRKH